MDSRTQLVFIDFENIARAIRQNQLDERVDLRAILTQLEERGRVLLKRAYADWGYYKDYRTELLQYGVEAVQVFSSPRDRESWKSTTDVRLAVDVMEAIYRTTDATDIVLVTGDGGLLPLVTRLREYGKTVVGLGLKSASSQYFVRNCDDFIQYEEIAEWSGEDGEHRGVDGIPGVKRDSRSLLLATVRRMADRQGLPGMPPPGTPLKAAAVRAAMRRNDPSWDERTDGHTTFVDFLQAHEDVVLCGRPADAADYFVAERNTVAEGNLQKMLDQFTGGEATGERDEVIEALRKSLRTLGSPDGTTDLPQRISVRGTQLKAQLKQEMPGFDESLLGFPTFLDFLLSLREQFRVARPDSRGDVLVAERESPAEASLVSLPLAAPTPYASASQSPSSGTWVQTPAQRYMGALRIRRIRSVPMEERYSIIVRLFEIFRESHDKGEIISLKDAKDRLHQTLEQGSPSISWDSINNVVYHLFWTYCFEFGDGPDDVPLWERPTAWTGGAESAEEVIRRCDLGLIRMISDVVGQVDPVVVAEVLGDGSPERLPYFEDICSQINSRFAPGARN